MDKISIFYNKQELSYSDHLLSCKVTATGLSKLLAVEISPACCLKIIFTPKTCGMKGLANPRDGNELICWYSDYSKKAK